MDSGSVSRVSHSVIAKHFKSMHLFIQVGLESITAGTQRMQASSVQALICLWNVWGPVGMVSTRAKERSANNVTWSAKHAKTSLTPAPVVIILTSTPTPPRIAWASAHLVSMATLKSIYANHVIKGVRLVPMVNLETNANLVQMDYSLVSILK